jgi:O-antigen ligase
MISKTLNVFKAGADEGKVGLFYLLIAVFLFQLFCGGAPNTPTIKFQIGLFLSLALLAAALWEGAWSALLARDKLLALALVGLWLVPLVQIIPLPPGIADALPGQRLEQGILDYVGRGDLWRPMTADLGATQFSILTLVPATAVFLAALVIGPEQRKLLLRIVLVVAFLAAFVAFFQFVSAGTTFDFYKTAHKGFGIGFFANRNHQADFIVIAMLLAAALLIRDAKDRQAQLIGLALVAILAFAAVMATFSRAGMAFFLLGFIAVAIAAMGLQRIRWRPALAAVVVIAGVGAAVASTHQFERFLARLDTAADDQRFEYAAQSMPIIGDYFPAGSGMGTFVSVYEKYETIDRVVPNFANHLHNDYLEIVMEGGLLGALALLVGLAAIGRLAFRSLRDPLRPSGLPGAAAAVGVGFLLLHSLIDYPLRTQALACLFAVLVVLMLARGEGAPGRSRSRA